MQSEHSVAPAAKRSEPHSALSGLPPFPAVAAQLLNILSDDNFETRRLVDLIRADSTFASELLNSANSVEHGLKKEISSIQHAVAILGQDTLKSLALAVSLRMYLGRVLQQDALARVWRHSLATAVVSELLAQACSELRGGSHGETPYVAGLLHNLGGLSLMLVQPRQYAGALATAARERRDLREVERNLFGICHCEAGRWIARAWKFSPLIGEITFEHHEPVSGVEFTLVDLVKVAVQAADSAGYEIVPPPQTVTPGQVLEMLPASARSCFEHSPEKFREAICRQIHSSVRA